MKKLDPYGDGYRKLKIALALELAPNIYPCYHCGGPVARGYCCRRCGSDDPEGAVVPEERAKAGK